MKKKKKGTAKRRVQARIKKQMRSKIKSRRSRSDVQFVVRSAISK